MAKVAAVAQETSDVHLPGVVLPDDPHGAVKFKADAVAKEYGNLVKLASDASEAAKWAFLLHAVAEPWSGTPGDETSTRIETDPVYEELRTRRRKTKATKIRALTELRAFERLVLFRFFERFGEKSGNGSPDKNPHTSM